MLAAHGITASHVSFESVAEALAGGVRLVAPDLRGRGHSRDVAGPWGMEVHAADLMAVLDRLGEERADVLLGHSMGGFVGAVTAALHPGRVGALVMVDGGLPLMDAVPEGLSTEQLIHAVIGPAMERLDMTFPSVESYFDYWRKHPAFDAWSEKIERYVAYDLVGEPPELRPRTLREAVLGDTESQLVSELFGHGKGAFAGADRARRGLFAEADGGTVFLDRIEQLPLPLQLKTLHVLQEEAVRPVGDGKSQAIDVRVIAATARDLEQEISAGRFREDLFYRLNVVQLHVPALRDRREDIPLLVDNFLTHFRRALGKDIQGIADDALERLTAHHWPGNLRELENVMERAMILSDGDWLTLDCLPQNIVSAQPGLPDDAAADFGLKDARRAFEARMIRRALRATNGNRTHAARLLEISHRALLYKIKEYGVRD